MDANAIQQMLDHHFPFTRFIGLQVKEIEPGKMQLRLPFAPDVQNHIGTVYAGAIFSLAEIAGGVALLLAFDPAKYLMVARRLEIDYLRPARTDLFCTPHLSGDLAAETHAVVAELGKADLPLTIEVVDTEGEIVSQVAAIYHVRQQ
jgi:uncharacterized protein (TIGR00369 family)